MQLSEQESRVAVAALQTLERHFADEIEMFAEPTYTGVPPRLQSALDHHETIAALTKKLATAGDHEVDQREVELTILGLGPYLELLTASVEMHLECDDFLLEPEQKSREAELHRSRQLYDKLARWKS